MAWTGGCEAWWLLKGGAEGPDEVLQPNSSGMPLCGGGPLDLLQGVVPLGADNFQVTLVLEGPQVTLRHVQLLLQAVIPVTQLGVVG